MAKMAKRVIQQRLAIGPETFEVIERVSHALGDHFQRGVSDTLDFEDLDGFTGTSSRCTVFSSIFPPKVSLTVIDRANGR